MWNSTHIRSYEVRPRRQVRNVERDLNPSLDSLDLLGVLGLVDSEVDLSSALLGRHSAFGRLDGGDIRDLRSALLHIVLDSPEISG